MIYESTIEIERPINEVFEVTTCMRRCVVWDSALSNSQMDTNESARVGSTFTAEYEFLGRSYPFKGMITELDAPRTFAFKTIEGVEFSALYAFSPTERGTQFRLAYEVEEMPAPVRKVLNNRLAKKVINKMLHQSQERLKILIEDDFDLWTLTNPAPSA